MHLALAASQGSASRGCAPQGALGGKLFAATWGVARAMENDFDRLPELVERLLATTCQGGSMGVVGVGVAEQGKNLPEWTWLCLCTECQEDWQK